MPKAEVIAAGEFPDEDPDDGIDEIMAWVKASTLTMLWARGVEHATHWWVLRSADQRYCVYFGTLASFEACQAAGGRLDGEASEWTKVN